jgi:hypothetical protein
MRPNKNEDGKSGGLVASENIRPQIGAGHLPISDRLDGGPILGVQEDLVVDPVGDRLLADGRAIHRLGEPFSEGRLGATANRDSAAQRSNVRFIHDGCYSTNRFVAVNNPVCMTLNKEACTVLQMPTIKRKAAHPQPRSNLRVALPGPDGKTLGQRVREAVAYESGRRGKEYRQSELVEDVRRLSGLGDDMKLQQAISAIMRDKVTKSSQTPYIARACHVDGIWLASGLGAMIPKS